jgi:antitoxin VapB
MFAKPPVFFAQIHVGYSALSFDSDCNNAAIGDRFTTRVTQILPVRVPGTNLDVQLLATPTGSCRRAKKTSTGNPLDLRLCMAYAKHTRPEEATVKRTTPPKKSRSKRTAAVAKRAPSMPVRRASIFRNGSNQAVRLPQDLRFPSEVKEVRIRRQGDGLLITPMRPDWASFFAINIDLPDDFLEGRKDDPPQTREPL